MSPKHAKPAECEWFGACHADSFADVWHPTIDGPGGWVPVCRPHYAWLLEDAHSDGDGLIINQTKFVPPLVARAMERHPEVFHVN